MNDLDGQFATLPVASSTKNIGTLDGVEEALRIRAAFSIYQSVTLGITKDKATTPYKKLLNEIYQQE